MSSKQGQKTPPSDVKLGHQVIIIVSVITFILGIFLILLSHLASLSILFSSLGGAFLATGITIGIFQYLHFNNISKLTDNLSTKADKKIQALTKSARKTGIEIGQVSSIRQLIAGGNNIWNTLERELIKKSFYLEREDIIYYIGFYKENPDYVEVYTYDFKKVKNGGPGNDTYPVKIKHEYFREETDGHFRQEFGKVIINGKEYSDKQIIKCDDQYAQKPDEIYEIDKGAHVKFNFFHEEPVDIGQVIDVNTFSRDVLIKQDFYITDIATSAEILLIQAFYDPRLKVDLWFGDSSQFKHRGIADNTNVNNLKPEIYRMAKEAGIDNLQEHYAEYKGLIKNQSFVMNWYPVKEDKRK